jgi:hypothetical protein
MDPKLLARLVFRSCRRATRQARHVQFILSPHDATARCNRIGEIAERKRGPIKIHGRPSKKAPADAPPEKESRHGIACSI